MISVTMECIASSAKSKVPDMRLRSGQAVVVGRSNRADYSLRFDRSVSSRHLRLECDEGRITMKDLNSTNGSFLNGEAVTKAELQQGDVFRIGDCEFRVVVNTPDNANAVEFPMSFQTEAIDPESLSELSSEYESSGQFHESVGQFPHLQPHSPSTNDADGTAAINKNRIEFTSLDPSMFDKIEETAETFRDAETPTTSVRGFESESKDRKGNRRGPLRLTINCECPDGKTDRIIVRRGQTVSVGKSAMSDFQFSNSNLNSLHFRLRLADNGASVIDNKSKHGTSLNGQRIEEAELLNDDLIEAGQIKFRVHLNQESSVSREVRDMRIATGPSGPSLSGQTDPSEAAVVQPKNKHQPKIKASQKQEYQTGLIAIKGNVKETNLEALVEFCQTVLGDFQLLVDYQRLGDKVPEQVDSPPQSSASWFGPIEKETPMTTLTQYGSGSEAAVAYEAAFNADVAIGVVTQLSVAESSKLLQEVGGVWAMGWPGLVRVSCESGNREIVQPIFESLTAIVVEAEKPGGWNLFLAPEMEERAMEMIELDES